MRRGAKPLGMVSGSFWGLLRGPASLPVLFGSRQDAVDNMDSDEYLVHVAVRPANLRDLLKGEQTLISRQRAKAERGRPRVPDTEKRRRGTAVKITGLGPLKKALQEAGPKFRKRFERDLAQAVGKGGRRAAPTRVRR